jgi:hypothetical protein
MSDGKCCANCVEVKSDGTGACDLCPTCICLLFQHAASKDTPASPVLGDETERTGAQCHGCKRDYEAEGHDTIPIDWSTSTSDGECVLECPDYPDCSPRPVLGDEERGRIEELEEQLSAKEVDLDEAAARLKEVERKLAQGEERDG